MADATAVLCPHCQARLRVAAAAGRKVQCPKCQKSFSTAQSDVCCPACKGSLPPGSVFCTSCGYDFRTKKRLEKTFVQERAPKKKKKSDEPRRDPDDNLDVPSWSSILAMPFNVEFVVAETIVLLMWAVFWTGLVVSIVVAIFLLTGAMAIFAGSALVAGLVRAWMLTSDVSAGTVFKTFLALLGGSVLVGVVVSKLYEEDAAKVAVLAFFGLVLLAVCLRAASFFFGRYFGICRRAALKTAISNPDRGGFVDLAFALVLGLFAGFPLIGVLVAQAMAANAGVVLPGGDWGFVGMAACALFWAYFYLPMGIAVVALRDSLNPLIVFEWIGRMFVDYIALLMVMLPFHLFVWAASAAISFGLSRMIDIGPVFWGGMAALYWCLADIVLDQYMAVATMASLGLLLRRNEERIGWLPYARRLQ